MSDFAFPNDMPSRHGGDNLPFDPGLTKRELFAAMAMQSLIGLMEARDAKSGWSSRAASTAVACADALLAELAKATP